MSLLRMVVGLFGNAKNCNYSCSRWHKEGAKKNTVDFCGKPMIVWTIEATLRTNLFDQVLVSTDSQEIDEIAESFGASVPFLRKENCDDLVPISHAAISTLKKGKDY
jgi:CMP-N-acetylneuraminic acid synthetase